MLEDTIVITFSGTSLHREYQKEFHRLYKNNFRTHVDWIADDIKDTDFYKQNMHMFRYKKYFGYFLWKPYIILQTLKMYDCKNVLYCDSNLRLNNFSAFENVFSRFMKDQDVFFVEHVNYKNREWTKRDTFIAMNADEPRYWDANQVWTSLMGFGKSDLSMNLLEIYLGFCKDPEIVTELPNVYGEENLPEFKEHRWEQSVMSILVERFGYKGFPDSSIMKWVTKEYSPELMKMKEEVNKDPFAKNEHKES